MNTTVSIGVIGDFRAATHTHSPVAQALQHSAAKLGLQAKVEWVPTSALEQPGSESSLERFDGLFAASGSPYRSFAGMLRGIEFARTRNWPFVGTWSGFQYTLVECARNLLKLVGADSAENNPRAPHIIIYPVACALPQTGAGPKLSGQIPGVRLKPGSLLSRIYGCEEIVEYYYCNYEVNPAYEPQLASAGLHFVARASGGEARAVELPGHRFFIATLFQTQMSSTPDHPHPLLTALIEAAAEFNRQRTAPLEAAQA